jgi:alpha-galactosidase
MIGRFTRMSDAIAEFATLTNVTFQYSLCQWGWNQPWVWGRRIAQSWRNTGDIKPYWAELAAIINTASFHPEAANFFGHNDLDLLEVGNTGRGSPPGNLTYDEAKSHFTAWALLKSPLFISTDLRNASEETFEILGNRDIIKINQDPIVGESLTPFRWGVNDNYVYNATHPAEYWSGNSSYGIVFMVLNSLNTPQQMSFNLTESWAIKTGRQYKVYDLWKHEVTGVAVRYARYN